MFSRSFVSSAASGEETLWIRPRPSRTARRRPRSRPRRSRRRPSARSSSSSRRGRGRRARARRRGGSRCRPPAPTPARARAGAARGWCRDTSSTRAPPGGRDAAACRSPPAVEDDREVRLALLRERRRERDEDRVDIAEHVVVGRGAEAPSATSGQRLRGDVLDVASPRRSRSTRCSSMSTRTTRRPASANTARAARRRSLRRRSPRRTSPPRRVALLRSSRGRHGANATRAVARDGRDSRTAHGNRLDNPAGRRDTLCRGRPFVVGETAARGADGSLRPTPASARAAAPASSEAMPHEERKLVSILFVDLEGFTAASDAADPEDVRDALARYHAVARERIEAYGGTLEKFIGDAVMAVFGACRARRRRRAGGLCGAPRPRGSRGAERERASRSRRVPLSTRARRSASIGGTAGEALAIGDVVNTAARLQAAAPVGGSSSGRRRAARPGTRSRTRRSRLSSRRARRRPSRWLATGVISDRRASRHDRAVRRPPRELDVIRSVWRQAIADRRPQVVTVVGPPGSGSRARARDRRRGRGIRRAGDPRPVPAVRGADGLPRLGPAGAPGVRDLRLGRPADRTGEAREGVTGSALPRPRTRRGISPSLLGLGGCACHPAEAVALPGAPAGDRASRRRIGRRSSCSRTSTGRPRASSTSRVPRLAAARRRPS